MKLYKENINLTQWQKEVNEFYNKLVSEDSKDKFIIKTEHVYETADGHSVKGEHVFNLKDYCEDMLKLVKLLNEFDYLNEDFTVYLKEPEDLNGYLRYDEDYNFSKLFIVSTHVWDYGSCEILEFEPIVENDVPDCIKVLFEVHKSWLDAEGTLSEAEADTPDSTFN